MKTSKKNLKKMFCRKHKKALLRGLYLAKYSCFQKTGWECPGREEIGEVAQRSPVPVDLH